jgi:hypothetical protein
VSREHPILFGDALVRAILADTKTETRRPIACQDFESIDADGASVWIPNGRRPSPIGAQFKRLRFPFGKPGDRLWVREAWHPCGPWETSRPVPGKAVRYRADDAYVATPDAPDTFVISAARDRPGSWRPSIHMPRWASRIVLDVIDVRVERVQDIDEASAHAEGFEPQWIDGAAMPHRSARAQFSAAWATIYGAEAWDSNPWIWVVAFHRVGAP